MHWCCCSELIVHTNLGITVKCLLSDVWYFTFLQSLFFLLWNYMCLGIEALFDLSIFTAVDKVKDVYCITRCEKIIEHVLWHLSILYTTNVYCSIVTIWVHFKRNYNLFDQVLINVLLLYCFLFIWIDCNYFLLQAWPKDPCLTQACLALITWTVYYLMNLLIKN